MRWTDIPVHVIDFEGSRASGILEFGVVTLVGGTVASVATRLCRASGRIGPDDTRVHGLSERDLADAEPFASEWERFAGLRASGVLAAHFSGTENALLRGFWPCPRLSPDFLRPGQAAAEWGPWIDTGRLAAGRVPAGASAGLAEVVAWLDLGSELARVADAHCPPARRGFHCALFDAIAAALVLKRLACDGTSGEAWSLARVLAESTADRGRRDDLAQGRLF